MRTLQIALSCIALAAATGCSVLVSNELDEKGPGTDAGRDASMPETDAGPMGCTGAADGTPCGTGFVCVSEECVEAACTGPVDCDDGDACNGTETCASFGACETGTIPADGTACVQIDGTDGVCASGRCVPVGCGNGAPDAGEECDDGMNGDDLDGCRDDCTFTCDEDLECDNGDPCDGEEACDLASHTCLPGTPPVCADADACTMDTCETGVGCAFPLIDGDGDGHAPDSLDCGDDCDDARSDVYEGAAEICGDGRDNDCNGTIDDGIPTWYIDCDEDTYAADTTGARTACMEPSSTETGCMGGWTLRRPVDGSTTDCADGERSARPGQTLWFTAPIAGEPTSSDFDYDCNGTEEQRYTNTGLTGAEVCYTSGGICYGLQGWTGSFAPACGATGTFTSCYTDRSTGSCLRNRGYTLTQQCR